MCAFNQKALFPFQISAKRRLFTFYILHSDWFKSHSHWHFDQSETRTELALQIQKVEYVREYVLIKSLKYYSLHQASAISSCIHLLMLQITLGITQKNEAEWKKCKIKGGQTAVKVSWSFCCLLSPMCAFWC